MNNEILNITTEALNDLIINLKDAKIFGFSLSLGHYVKNLLYKRKVK